MKFDNILVKGCPLCDIFLEPRKHIHTKLYYPLDIDMVSQSEFVVLDCETCNTPMIVVRDHIEEIHKENWGRLLRISRRLFGNAQLRCKPRKILDHYHCHVIKKKEY